MSLVNALVTGAPPSRGAHGISRLGGGTWGTSAAGVAVDEERAMMVGAAFAVISFIGRTCGAFPRRITERGDQQRRDIRTDEFKHVWGSPGPGTVGLSFWESMFAAIDGWGNGYAWQGRDDRVRFDPRKPWVGVRQLEFLQPKFINLGLIDGRQKGFAIGAAQERPYTTEEILHIPSFSMDGIRGLSPVRVAANALGLAIAAETYGSLFFKNGSSLSGIITSKAVVTAEQAKEVIETWDEEHQGLNNAHLLGVIGGDARYERIGIPPNEAQFLETRLHQREELLSFYGPIPHHLLGWRSNTSNFGTGIEQQNLGLLMFVLLNRLRRVEEYVETYLLPPEMQFRFVVSGLLRGDLKTQAQFMKAMREMGVYSADRVLDLLDEPPRGIEDDYLTPGNMQRIAASSGEQFPGMGQQRQVPARPRQGGRGVAAIARPHCPVCDSSFAVSDVVTATLWCRKCKAERPVVDGAFVTSVPRPTEDRPRDGQDLAERLASEIMERL